MGQFTNDKTANNRSFYEQFLSGCKRKIEKKLNMLEGRVVTIERDIKRVGTDLNKHVRKITVEVKDVRDKIVGCNFSVNEMEF